MPLYLVEPPATPVITLTQAKAHLRVSHSDDDALITSVVAAATKHVEDQLQRALMPQTWELRLDWFPSCGWGWGGYSRHTDSRYYDDIQLPLAPLIEVNSVKYRGSDGAEQTFDAASYHVVGAGGDRSRISLVSGQSWPTTHRQWPEGVIVNFDVGYDDLPVPTPIVQAIKLLVSQLYEHREEFVMGANAPIAGLPMTVASLLQPYRNFA